MTTAQAGEQLTVLLDRHRRATAMLDAVLTSISARDLDRATPCAAWDLRALLAHQLGQNRGLAEAIRSGTDSLDIWAPRPLGELGAQAVTASAAELTQTMVEAPDPEHPVWMPEISRTQPFTLLQVAAFHLLDTVVHSWDIARSVGRGVRIDADVLGAVEALTEQVPDGPGRELPGAAFARRVTGGEETGLPGVLRSLGRDPSWTPG